MLSVNNRIVVITERIKKILLMTEPVRAKKCAIIVLELIMRTGAS
jgi:hypothetical protein